MTLIDNKSFLDDDIDKNIKPYSLPTLVKTRSEVFSFGGMCTISTIVHAVTIGLIWLISIILMLLGIHLFQFSKIKMEPKRDIEFVLVDKQAPPKDVHTKNRAEINSRTGGVRDPKRKVSMPSPSPRKQQKASKAASEMNKLIKKQQQKQQLQQQQQKRVVKSIKQPTQNVLQKITKKPVQPQTQVDIPSPSKPAPPTARPSARPISAPIPVAKPSSKFAVPVPKGAPIGRTLSTGPVGGTSAPTGARSGGSASGAYSGSRSGGYAPRPSLSPSASHSGGQLSRGGYGGGHGNYGNPGGGGGAPGIDAIREPDFGPYMRDLQNRIKRNWDPPKGNESKTVVLLFKIAKDGRLLSSRVSRSSGLPSADQAALKAVELTAPFRPLPPDFRGQSIDIQFTFDYRVFGGRRY